MRYVKRKKLFLFLKDSLQEKEKSNEGECFYLQWYIPMTSPEQVGIEPYSNDGAFGKKGIYLGALGKSEIKNRNESRAQ